MVQRGLGKLKEKRKFELSGKNDVIVRFGKYQDLSFKEISEIDESYLNYLEENWFNNMSSQVQARLRHWQSKASDFFI